jgi:hypothetical protein
LVPVVMPEIKKPSRFQKVLQVVFVINGKTQLVLPSKFRPFF